MGSLSEKKKDKDVNEHERLSMLFSAIHTIKEKKQRFIAVLHFRFVLISDYLMC